VAAFSTSEIEAVSAQEQRVRKRWSFEKTKRTEEEAREEGEGKEEKKTDEKQISKGNGSKRKEEDEMLPRLVAGVLLLLCIHQVGVIFCKCIVF
jgi:hypothetical protein